MSPDLGDAVMALVRRYGRRGVNEATVWTLLRPELPTLEVSACTGAVERLIGEGRLYRQRRRTRTMLHCGSDAAVDVAGVDEPAGLF